MEFPEKESKRDIWKAALYADINRIKELLDQGVDINSIDPMYGSTPLMFAAERTNETSSLDTVKFLLDRGADINFKNSKFGMTSLMFAVRNSNKYSNLETVKLLLDRGADLEIQDDSHNTALMYAVNHSNNSSSLETVKLLIDRGANLNVNTYIEDEDIDLNPLFLAVINSRNNLNTVILLLEKGANPFVRVKCPTEECNNLINEARWARLSKRDRELASKYNQSIPITKDIWLLIMRHKRQQQLCSNLQSDTHRELLKYFALELEIPLETIQTLNKAQLCGLISRQITFRDYDKFMSEKETNKRKLLEIANRYGINISQPIDRILNDLSRLFQ